ncbi:MAG: hypothetical protein WCI18_15845, partial [Pseudomonadota bacterium]
APSVEQPSRSVAPSVEQPSRSVAPSVEQPLGCAIQPGRFRIGGAIFYSNGSAFCVYKSWDDYKAAGGGDDTSSIPLLPSKPACMRDDGACIVNK